MQQKKVATTYRTYNLKQSRKQSFYYYSASKIVFRLNLTFISIKDTHSKQEQTFQVKINSPNLVKKKHGQTQIPVHSQYRDKWFKHVYFVSVKNLFVSVPLKPAGNSTIRNNSRRPKPIKATDSTEYGNMTSSSCIIQPSLFEHYGVYEDGLGILRPKEEVS